MSDAPASVASTTTVKQARSPRLSPGRFLALCCLVGYWAVAHGVGNFYPISSLGMFRDKMTSASRIVARPLGGEPIEIAYYDDWSCPLPLDFSNEAHPNCPPAEFSAYDSIVIDYILSHQGRASGPASAGEPVEIVRRQFVATESSAPLTVSDCALLTCTARRREPPKWMPRL